MCNIPLLHFTLESSSCLIQLLAWSLFMGENTGGNWWGLKVGHDLCWIAPTAEEKCRAENKSSPNPRRGGMRSDSSQHSKHPRALWKCVWRNSRQTTPASECLCSGIFPTHSNALRGPRKRSKWQQEVPKGPGHSSEWTNCSQHQEVPFPSSLPCWSWAALAQPCPSQADASSNANSGYFYYCNLNSFLSLRKYSHAFALFRPLGLQEYWSGRITCWEEKKSRVFLKLTHSTQIKRKALASPRIDWKDTLCYMTCPFPEGYMVSGFCLQ